jgi:hypothetical protein
LLVNTLKLKLGSDWSTAEEQQRVHTAMRAAAVAAINAHLAQAKAPSEWTDELRMEIVNRVAPGASEGVEQTPKDALLLELRGAAIKAERKELNQAVAG